MSPTTAQRIVVLGGGIGGQVAATRLKQKLGDEARVLLVERSTTFTFAPSLLWLMVGKREPRTITRDYSRIVRRGVEVAHATVTGIDTAAAEIQTESGTIGYDYLVVALGAALDLDRIPGLSEHTYHPYDLPSAERLRDALSRFTGGKVTVAIASLPYKCPGCPVRNGAPDRRIPAPARHPGGIPDRPVHARTAATPGGWSVCRLQRRGGACRQGDHLPPAQPARRR